MEGLSGTSMISQASESKLAPRPMLGYRPHPKHRSGAPGASQWTITTLEERACFELSAASGWLAGTRGIGVHILGGKARNLGVARGGVTFIAVFRAGSEWHGYPEDTRAARVTSAAAKAWHENGWIGIRAMRCLVRGQLCSP